MRNFLVSASAFALAAVPSAASAQDSGDAPAPVATTTTKAAGEVYTPADFARFAPRNALDMLRQVPGFTIVSNEQGRGLGQTSDNVVINGERLPSKSDSLTDQLGRIDAARVLRIEIVDGSTLGIPGLSGPAANVITKPSAISGRFEYRAIARPRFAPVSFGGGEVSVSGSAGQIEWSAAYTHGVGRGGAGDGQGALIFSPTGALTERRDVLFRFRGEFPKLSGRVKWTSPNGTIANLNASYGLKYTISTNDEDRDSLAGVDSFRRFTNVDDGHDYEIGGDLDFGFGPGRLKLIGITRADEYEGPATSLLEFANGNPTQGSRFDQVRNSSEKIGRAEYRWDMLGGGWQLDAEAAFNTYYAVSSFATLDAAGNFVDIPFPGSSGGVTEDRYETILTHSRTLGRGLTVQLGAGGEYSKLSQSGPGGLTRTFWRPKGSMLLAWTPRAGLDLSLKLARTVGQLSFGDFLAGIDLQQNNTSAGNVELVPQQAWELNFEAKKNLGVWGSVTLGAYAQQISDYIEFIPIAGSESRGNITSATLIGASLNATINFDPLGWKGAKLTAEAEIDRSDLADPLTGLSRYWSGDRDRRAEVDLRYDIPGSDWATGAGFEYNHVRPNVRLYETSVSYEGPIYTSAFIEHKDVLGMTVNLSAFNLTNGNQVFYRTVYSGLRDRSPVLFVEDRRSEVSTIYRLTVKGSF